MQFIFWSSNRKIAYLPNMRKCLYPVEKNRHFEAKALACKPNIIERSYAYGFTVHYTLIKGAEVKEKHTSKAKSVLCETQGLNLRF